MEAGASAADSSRVQQPTRGDRYVLNVCQPHDFHASWGQSRFRLLFSSVEGAYWRFGLAERVRHDGQRIIWLDAFITKCVQGEGLDAPALSICRFVGKREQSEDWLLGSLSPEDASEPVGTLLPAWLYELFRRKNAG